MHKGYTGTLKVLCKALDGPGRLGMGMADSDTPAESQGVPSKPLELPINGGLGGNVVQKNIPVPGGKMEVSGGFVGL
jgi:hypothetical protein